MRDLTCVDAEHLPVAVPADEPFQMDEETFRAFYERTARPVWAYLSRLTGDRNLADDLLQETYYRLLRSPRLPDTDAHRRNLVYRIATNLARDHHRRARFDLVPVPADEDRGAPSIAGDAAERAVARTDLSRSMARLTPRERAMLWLAYAQGASHEEIAGALGLKTGSIKLLLFRARRRLAALLTATRETTHVD
jgi:RNA polymerase sigma-70 factor (ECF subfamily)